MSKRQRRIDGIEQELIEVIHDHDNHDVPLGEQFEATANILLAVAGQFQYRSEERVDQEVLERLSKMIRKQAT